MGILRLYSHVIQFLIINFHLYSIGCVSLENPIVSACHDLLVHELIMMSCSFSDASIFFSLHIKTNLIGCFFFFLPWDTVVCVFLTKDFYTWVDTLCPEICKGWISCSVIYAKLNFSLSLHYIPSYVTSSVTNSSWNKTCIFFFHDLFSYLVLIIL